MISIIVPIYNSEQYLIKTLESILLQTFTDFEVLLIDDGSTDNSRNICNEYVTKDKRFKYFYKSNSGVADARNLGLDNVIGSHISFIDSDDIIDKDFLKILYKQLNENNVDISVCNIKAKNDKKIISDLEFCNYQLQLGSSTLWNKLYKKEVFNDIRFPSGKLFEDNYVFHHLFAKNRYKLCLINKKLYHYQHNCESITRSSFSKERLDDFVIGMHKRMEFFKSKKMKKPYKQSQYLLLDYIIGNFNEEEVKKDKEIIKILKKNIINSNLFYKTKLYILYKIYFP